VLTWKIDGACTAFLTVGRVERKQLFMVAGLGMGASMAGLAGTFYDIKSPFSSIVAVFFLFMFMAFFPLGFLGSNFLTALRLRRKTCAFVWQLSEQHRWLFNFVIAEITPVAFVMIGWRYYIVYAVIGAPVCPLVYFFFLETKGKSLEEMGWLFSEPENF
jgi:Sugar (and other) transporter